MYKIVYKKKECIGAGACEYAYPEGWEFIKDTQISTLKDPNTIKTEELETLDFEADDFAKHLEAAQVCPVNVIEIYDETGKKVYPED